MARAAAGQPRLSVAPGGRTVHHLRQLLVRTALTHATLGRVLPRLEPQLRRRDLLLTSAALSLAGYLADLWILPRQGNRRAAAADAGLAVATLCLLRRALPGLRLGLPALLAGAAAVALQELWLHEALDGDGRRALRATGVRRVPG